MWQFFLVLHIFQVEFSFRPKCHVDFFCFFRIGGFPFFSQGVEHSTWPFLDEILKEGGTNTDFHPEMQRQMINQVSFSSAVGVQTDQGHS